MVKPLFRNASIEFEHMGKAVAMGTRKYYPGLSFESLCNIKYSIIFLFEKT